MVITLKLDKNIKKSGHQSIYFYVSHGKSGQVNQIRKKIYPNLEVSSKQFDLKNFRAKSSHSNYTIINSRLDELKALKSVSQTKFDAGQYNTEQVILHLKGEADIESVDSYIETFVKNQKAKKTTYTDYKYTLNAFKKHLGWDRNRTVTFNEFTNYSLLVNFKKNALDSGVRATSVNSYFKKIKAISNDAYDNQVIFELPYFNKRLTIKGAERKEVKALEKNKFKESINKANTIYEVQALCFWLLMFTTRGMYFADLVKFKAQKLRNDENEDTGLDNEYTKFCKDGYDYIVHNRSKNEGRSSDRMIIRIDNDSMVLFKLLKRSVWCTHYDKRKKLGLNEDPISIFGHNVDDIETHKIACDVYQKKISKLVDSPFKSARQTFNNYARKLKISQDMRNVLLGHVNTNIIKHYDDLSFLEDEVHKLHVKILNEYRVPMLVKSLEKRFAKLGYDFINSEDIILEHSLWANPHSKKLSKMS